MIDFNNLNVTRIIIHAIISKQPNQDSASVKYENDVLEIDENVLETVRIRLIDAAGKNSKAFELEIENTTGESFFSIASELHNQNNDNFIANTREIAGLLAKNQKRTSIPGGYLLIMDCIDNEAELPVCIVIKAEPHEALQFTNVGGHSQVSLLKQVFLSPSQKLYKIGILYAKSAIENDNKNDQYGCFLYDDQFRAESHPAEYFYKDFLGFTIGNINPAIKHYPFESA